MKFYKSEIYRPRLQEIFEELEERVHGILPHVVIEHIGSSAIKGAVSKGDLDVFVGVPKEEFRESIEKIKNLGFFEKDNTLCNDDIHMLVTGQYEGDVAIQVVVRGSEFEDFIEFRDLLIAKPKLLHEYNELKLSSEGFSEDQYREKKSSWIERIFKEYLVRGNDGN